MRESSPAVTSIILLIETIALGSTGQYYTKPPPAKSEEEKEAARKKILEEADELDMFGDGGDFVGAEDSDEEEPEVNAHLKNDPYGELACCCMHVAVDGKSYTLYCLMISLTLLPHCMFLNLELPS